MGEYWKSNAKKYCDFCKVWIADNKASVQIHENGKNHKEKVAGKLYQIKKATTEKAEEDKKYNLTMAAIERAAYASMHHDLMGNPYLTSSYGSGSATNSAASNALGQAAAATATASRGVYNMQFDEKAAQKRKLEEQRNRKKPQSKIGEWQSANLNMTDLPIKSLDLPSANKMVKQLKAEAELEEELSSFSKELTENTEKIKTEIVDNIPIKSESDVAEPTAEKVEKKERITEKVVSLNSSSVKPVAFKKRKIEGQQQRQRVDD